MDVKENDKKLLLDTKVEEQGINFLFERMPDAIVMQLILPFVFVTVMWQTQDRFHLIVWSIVVLVAYVSRYFFARIYHKYRTTYRPAIWWANYYVLTTVCMSLMWGYASFVFFPSNSVAEQVFIITLALGLAAGTIFATAFWLKAMYAWTYPLLLILSFRLSLEATPTYYFIAMLLILYIFIVTKISRLTNKFIYETIRLRLKNNDLIDALKKEKAIAEEANRAKTQFLAAASHDLRQPLHALNLFSGLLKYHSNEKIQKELLFKVDGSLSALNNMLEKLLDLSRLDAGVLEKNIQNFNLKNLLNHLCSEYRNLANEKGLQLIAQYSSCYVNSDPVLLEVILRNLLSNAIRYTQKGSVSLICENELNNNSIIIKIVDTGIGIKEEGMNEIFSEYTQLNNPERDRTKGLGLGLAIVKRIAKLINCDITIESSYGKGTAFSLNLSHGSYEEIEYIPKSEINLHDLSVVFIDDEEDILNAMYDTLTLWGCKVLKAESAKEAVTLIRQTDFEPDVIISDYRLRQGLNGVSAINEISRMFDYKIVSYIVTGDTDPERLREAKASGYKVLHKPLQPEKLKQVLSRVNIRESVSS